MQLFRSGFIIFQQYKFQAEKIQADILLCALISFCNFLHHLYICFSFSFIRANNSSAQRRKSCCQEFFMATSSFHRVKTIKAMHDTNYIKDFSAHINCSVFCILQGRKYWRACDKKRPLEVIDSYILCHTKTLILRDFYFVVEKFRGPSQFQFTDFMTCFYSESIDLTSSSDMPYISRGEKKLYKKVLTCPHKSHSLIFTWRETELS